MDGQEYPVDCVIFATGFEAGISYVRLTGFEVVGRDGTAPQPALERWRAHPARHHDRQVPQPA